MKSNLALYPSVVILLLALGARAASAGPTPSPTPVPEYDAKFLSVDLPYYDPGGGGTFSCSVQNTGSAPWSDDDGIVLDLAHGESDESNYCCGFPPRHTQIRLEAGTIVMPGQAISFGGNLIELNWMDFPDLGGPCDYGGGGSAGRVVDPLSLAICDLRPIVLRMVNTCDSEFGESFAGFYGFCAFYDSPYPTCTPQPSPSPTEVGMPSPTPTRSPTPSPTPSVSPTPLPDDAAHAGFLSAGASRLDDYNVELRPDYQGPFTLLMRNTGLNAWDAEIYSVRATAFNNDQITPTGLAELRLVPGTTVSPGEVGSFTADIQTGPCPADAGSCGTNTIGWSLFHTCSGYFGEFVVRVVSLVPNPTPTRSPSPTPSPTPTPNFGTGDLDGSGCTDLGDFLILLDHWQENYGGVFVNLEEFLYLLDNWQAGPGC